MENVVCNELVARGYVVNVGVIENRKMYESKRETARTKIDFVANLGSKRYYVQSAFFLGNDAIRAQEVHSLNAIDDSFKKLVIACDDIRVSRNKNGIVTMGLRDFLLDPRSLDL